MNGYSDGTFKPNQTITRAEMAVAIHRIGGWGRSGADTVFSDVPFSAPSSYLGNDWMNVYFAVGQLANNGILASDTPCANDPTTKCFRPNDSLTRLETLWILERLPQAIAEGQVKVAQTNANTPTNPVPQPNRVTGALNDTGITFCGNSDTTNSSDPVVCAAADSGAYPRQDLRYGRDAQAAAGTLVKVGGGGAGFDFTKIANNGSVLPASATLGTAPTDWACTKDNVTGLIWEVKTTSGLRSQNHTYTWYNSNPATNGGSVGTASGGYCETSGRCDTEKYTQDVKAVGLCGATDWRMPTRKELVSIVDFGRVNPSIDPTYFPNTPASVVWSGSPNANDSSGAWVVYFLAGYSFNYFRNSSGGVRLVRGGQ